MGYSILRQIQFLLEKMNWRQNRYRQVGVVRSKKVRVRSSLMSFFSIFLPCLSSLSPSHVTLSCISPSSLSPVYLREKHRGERRRELFTISLLVCFPSLYRLFEFVTNSHTPWTLNFKFKVLFHMIIVSCYIESNLAANDGYNHLHMNLSDIEEENNSL